MINVIKTHTSRTKTFGDPTLFSPPDLKKTTLKKNSTTRTKLFIYAVLTFVVSIHVRPERNYVLVGNE